MHTSLSMHFKSLFASKGNPDSELRRTLSKLSALALKPVVASSIAREDDRVALWSSKRTMPTVQSLF